MSYRAFWEAGYRVFGLHPINPDGSCGCGKKDCGAAGKHPLVTNWQHTPIWSEEQLEVMEETGQVESGYGVLVRGLLVLDVDARNGGVESYNRLVSEIPELAGAGLIVETGSGGGSKHLYFKCDEGTAFIQHHPDYPGIDFKSSGYVVGPGSKHVTGNTYKILVGTPSDIDYAPDTLIAGLSKPNRYRAKVGGSTVDVSQSELGDMLSYVTNDDLDYEIWIRIGMALHHASHGSAYDLWHAWSSTSSKHNDADMSKKWHSFGKSMNPVTLGTLIYYAEKGGWERPITFEPNESLSEFMNIVEECNDIDVTGIDLTRPPGFVGDVAEWIHDQARYKREHLAVASALFSIGNVIGLRYSDELGDATSNVFVFCVAASGTGKEGIQQGAIEIHRAAGINKAVYSTIKSEQEVVRNLIRHQIACYIIDEVGIMLQKIANAQTRGGASYLEGVIGILMSAYSKANGFMPLGGDVREEVRRSILSEIAQIERKMNEEGETPKYKERRANLDAAYHALDNGLEKPFLSVAGYTTPVTFNKLVNFESAANGFFGRALIFNELDDVPPEKENFRRRPMPQDMKLAIEQLYTAGHYDMMADKIENRGDRIPIATTDEGAKMLKTAMLTMHSLAEDHAEKSGLSSLYLRSKELIAKISFILSAPSGLRDVEHVRWAYALVRRDIEAKIRLVIGNDLRKDAPKTALMNRLENLLSRDDGETFGVLVNKLRPAKKEEIEKCLEDMLQSGKAVLEESVHPRRKIKVKRYKLK
jgi:Bifunctional DNA primase/polymerase, N-terminal/Primase C terminal 2 (PriCT-2)